MTVMEYVMKTRLAAAKDMLLSTDLSIGEVAERSGFPSLAYFSRTFKSKIGMTPSKFKRAGKDK
jgi:transcriptional regulator GlxA family with amidase domain